MAYWLVHQALFKSFVNLMSLWYNERCDKQPRGGEFVSAISPLASQLVPFRATLLTYLLKGDESHPLLREFAQVQDVGAECPRKLAEALMNVITGGNQSGSSERFKPLCPHACGG
jgi:hypothetical protein